MLVKLQNVDKKIMKLESTLGDIPKQVDALKSKIVTIENELSRYKEEFGQCNDTKRKLEGNIQLLNVKLKKYREQVYSVTTNKEYDAISTEIEIKEKEIEDDETKVLELLEKEEKLNEQIQQLEEQYIQRKTELDENEKILQDKVTENEQELKRLTEERQLFVEKIEKPLYAHYERIRKGRNGIAVAEINKYTCEGCFATIPAQTVVEVRKMNVLLLCETCGRILVSVNNTTNSK